MTAGAEGASTLVFEDPANVQYVLCKVITRTLSRLSGSVLPFSDSLILTTGCVNVFEVAVDVVA